MYRKCLNNFALNEGDKLMLYMLIGLVSCALTISAPVCGAHSDTGIIHYGKETLESVQGNGRVTLDETEVKSSVSVTGSLSTHKANLGSIDVGGHAYLEKTTVFGDAKVSGFFSARETVFKKNLELTCQKVSLRRCDVGSITVHKTHLPFVSQVLELRHGTVCRGKIVFESGKGRVVLLGKSRVDGEVKGGKVEKG
jgi:hypothetical protein